MAEVYRKIIVGPDPKTGMKYIVGQDYFAGTICDIIKSSDNVTRIYVKKENGETVMWKDFNTTVPIHGEKDTRFNESAE